MALTLEQAYEIIHSLGYAGKMPCRVFSISAKRCKRGSKLAKIIGSICNKCYAMRGNFVRPSIRRYLDARQEAMSHPLWSEAMAIVITREEQSGFFRWYASGDMQSLMDLIKICDVCRRTPHIRHWLPTHEVGILQAFHRAGFKYPSNLVVRLSADMIEQKPNDSVMRRLGVRGSAVSKVAWSCPAYTTDNFCAMCRKCWDKRVKVVTYKYH